jgi:hypothetical protein
MMKVCLPRDLRFTPPWSWLRTCVALTVLLVISACASVYQAPDFSKMQQEHKTVALLPPTVTINAQSFKVGTPSAMIEQQNQQEAGALHRTLYAQFLAQQAKGRYTVEFQDIDDTLARLNQAGLTPTKLMALTRSDIAQQLGVDAVISTRVYRDKPMGAGAAIAGLLLVGASGATNEVQVNLSVHDRKTGRLVWNYDHLVSGGLISSAEGMAKSLMKSISKKFPYRKAKT